MDANVRNLVVSIILAIVDYFKAAVLPELDFDIAGEQVDGLVDTVLGYLPAAK